MSNVKILRFFLFWKIIYWNKISEVIYFMKLTILEWPKHIKNWLESIDLYGELIVRLRVDKYRSKYQKEASNLSPVR